MSDKAKMLPGGTSEGKQDWNTPQWIIDAAKSAHGTMWFRLDPFSNDRSLVPATTHWHEPKSEGDSCGFESPWEGPVFFNPPWNRTGDAVRKQWHEWSVRGVESVGVIPCGLNTRHWPTVERMTARCYLNRRPAFLRDGVAVKGNPKEVCITYCGDRPYHFAVAFAEHGRIHFGQLWRDAQ